MFKKKKKHKLQPVPSLTRELMSSSFCFSNVFKVLLFTCNLGYLDSIPYELLPGKSSMNHVLPHFCISEMM